MVLLCNELGHYNKTNQIMKVSEIWNRYCILAEETGMSIPSSYISRRSSFTEKLQKNMMNVFLFTSSKHRNPLERDTLLIPHNYANTLLSDTHYEAQSDDNDDMYEDTIAPYEPTDNSFIDMVHVALRLRKDLNQTEGHKGLIINKDDCINCVPDSIYMFLRMVYGGTRNIGQRVRL